MAIVPRDQLVSYEVLGSHLVEVKCILNDVWLVLVLSDAKDQQPLTPNSLLLLRGTIGLQFGVGTKVHCSRCWKQVNHLKKTLWWRWLNGYLLTLQQR